MREEASRMSNASDYHKRAMDLAFWTNRARNHRDHDEAELTAHQALVKELAALTFSDQNAGAGATTLLRSAGWLAIECNMPELAADLAEK